MKRLFLTLMIVIGGAAAADECVTENTAFKAGEFISYDLYFNWKFVWVKAGTASMSTVSSSYRGRKALRTSLLTRTSERVDRFFIMRDTLLSYVTEGLTPLYFRKGSHEGDRYYVDEIWFSYPRGGCHLKQFRLTHRGEKKWKESEYKHCVYDMMDIFLKARNFDISGMKKGDKIVLPIADGKQLFNSWITFRGREIVKMQGKDSKFRCAVFSFFEREDGKNEEVARFFVTDDSNHLPVRIDFFLRFGSAKAFLTGYKGLRNAMTARVR